jgi:hypothetical protein
MLASHEPIFFMHQSIQLSNLWHFQFLSKLGFHIKQKDVILSLTMFTLLYFLVTKVLLQFIGQA